METPAFEERADVGEAHVMLSTDGRGNWRRREWAPQCPASVFIMDRCQGVEGHEGDHWCFRKDGSFAWSRDKDHPEYKHAASVVNRRAQQMEVRRQRDGSDRSQLRRHFEPAFSFVNSASCQVARHLRRIALNYGPKLLVRAGLFALCAGVLSPVLAARDPLEAGFHAPPPEARPHTYWVWLNERMYGPSAIEELRAMKEAGLGGILLNSYGARGDKSQFPPVGPAFLSPKWLEQFKVAVSEARRLGLQFDVAVTSSADMGGPWIEPRHASMAIYAAETTTQGGRQLDLALPFPVAERATPRGTDGRPTYWKDVAVLALREPCRRPAHEFVLLFDPPILHPLTAVVFDQGQPNATADLAARMSPVREFAVAVSPGGTRDADFTEVLRGSLHAMAGPQRFALPPGVQGKLVRLQLLSCHDDSRPHWTLGEFELYDASGRNLAAWRAADRSRDGPLVVRAPMPLTYFDWRVRNLHDGRLSGASGVFATSGRPPLDIPDPREVVDLTASADREGRLRWEAPPGSWTVLRFVCMITGERLKVPGPASDGLASDKLNPEATRLHFNHVIAQLRKGVGENLPQSGVGDLYLPSYEVVGKSWSPGFADEFKRRRGYSLTRYLPAVAGARIVDEETTERFLFDYQKTLGEVGVDAYYRLAAEITNAAGLKLKSEAGGPGPPIHTPPFDALLAHGAVDNVQGEFWPFRPGSDAINVIKEPAAAAHLYGKRRVHLEAFTSNQHWAEVTQDHKPSADRVFCEGGNHFVWHKWVHVTPDAGMPGWAFHAGTHLNRNVTWWPKAHAFIDYLARGSFLLQQGVFVGDVLYYYGDGGSSFVKARKNPPSLGPGYDYDVANADIILNRLRVRDGRLVVPGGGSYAVLVLPERADIHPAVLERVADFVAAGATVIGPRPNRASGLEGFPRSDLRVQDLAARLWEDLDGRSRTSRRHGAGRIVTGRSERSVLEELGIKPDFAAPAVFDFTHRRDGGTEIYFVRNREANPVEEMVIFRDGAGAPEFWDPRTGAVAPVGAFRRVSGGVEMKLSLPAHGSIFVVFRGRETGGEIAAVSAGATIEADGSGARLVTDKAGVFTLTTRTGRSVEVRVPALPAPLALDANWTVDFASPVGSPPGIKLARVGPWTQQPAPEVKFFASTGRYRCTFEAPAGWRAAASRVELDLGRRLWSIGEVWLNGASLGVLWTAPFRVDCTAALRDGPNELTVEVVGTWHNRLVGEARGAAPRRTRTNITQSGLAEAQLIEAGLFGPVRLVPLAVQRLGEELTAAKRPLNRSRLLKNAKLMLEISCRAKAGESLLILSDDVLLPYADGLVEAARELGLVPLVLDIRPYLASDAYRAGAVNKPLAAAMEAADIVIENLVDTWVKNRPDFGRLSGNPHRQDESLSGERRWMILQCRGLDEWEIEPQQLMLIRRRTEWLLNLLRHAKVGRITTAAGTDFTFGLGGKAVARPILGIVPLYGEVAVTPDLETTFGSFVADGPTQLDVRPATELDRRPFTITVRAGRVRAVTRGDETQAQRLSAFIAGGPDAADAIDEVGLLTTPLWENDQYYWSDGTHHHDRAHIALGNNDRRDKLVHGAKHMDCEVIKPTIGIDGVVVYKEGIFNDALLP